MTQQATPVPFELIINDFLDADGRPLTPITPEESVQEDAAEAAAAPPAPARAPAQAQNQGANGAPTDRTSLPSDRSDRPDSSIVQEGASSTARARELQLRRGWMPAPMTKALTEDAIDGEKLSSALASFEVFLATTKLSISSRLQYASFVKQLVKAVLHEGTYEAVAHRLGQYNERSRQRLKSGWSYFQVHVRKLHGISQQPVRLPMGGSVIRVRHPLARDWALVASCLQMETIKRARYDGVLGRKDANAVFSPLQWDNRVFQELSEGVPLRKYVQLEVGLLHRTAAGELELCDAPVLEWIEAADAPVLLPFLVALQRIQLAAWENGVSPPDTAPVFVHDRATRMEGLSSAELRAIWMAEGFAPADIVTKEDYFNIGWRRAVHPARLLAAVQKKGRPAREAAERREAAEEKRKLLAAQLAEWKRMLSMTENLKPEPPDKADVLKDVRARMAKLQAEMDKLSSAE